MTAPESRAPREGRTGEARPCATCGHSDFTHDHHGCWYGSRYAAKPCPCEAFRPSAPPTEELPPRCAHCGDVVIPDDPCCAATGRHVQPPAPPSVGDATPEARRVAESRDHADFTRRYEAMRNPAPPAALPPIPERPPKGHPHKEALGELANLIDECDRKALRPYNAGEAWPASTRKHYREWAASLRASYATLLASPSVVADAPRLCANCQVNPPAPGSDYCCCACDARAYITRNREAPR